MKYFDKTQLVAGQIYVDDGGTSSNIIFKFIEFEEGKRELLATFIDNKKEYRRKGSCITCDIGKNCFRNATSTESKWLEDCIRLDKTITLEESIKLHHYEHYEIF